MDEVANEARSSMVQDQAESRSRRNVLKAIGLSAALPVATSVGAAWVFQTVFSEETQDEVDKKYLSALFDIVDPSLGIYAGSGNLRARAAGEVGISDYLKFSSQTLVDFVVNTLKLNRAVYADNLDKSFDYKPNKQSIFLGSPVANFESCSIMGYKRPSSTASFLIPEIDYEDSKVRWAFLFGEGDWGMYDGMKEIAGRYGSKGLVHRPVYKLVDKAEGRLAAPSTTDGMLNHEWLTVIRRKDKGKFRTVIAGMHGCGTQSFFDDFRQNMAELYKRVERVEEYQLIIPVELDHSAGLDGLRRTTGRLDWSQSDLHIIG